MSQGVARLDRLVNRVVLLLAGVTQRKVPLSLMASQTRGDR